MADGDNLTNRQTYEARNSAGEIPGAIGPLDWYRFSKTLKYVPRDVDSLMDCGCDRGHWLSYVLRHRALKKHIGIDVSALRIEEAHRRYPELNLTAGHLETRAGSDGEYEVVTALEVLEHIPRWRDVLDSLCSWARRRVIVTVPYRQVITMHPCIHCGKMTPPSGHIHSFSEETFPEIHGWAKTVDYIKDYGVEETDLPHRIYRILRPRVVWMVIAYDRTAPKQSVAFVERPVACQGGNGGGRS